MPNVGTRPNRVNTLRLRQNGRHFADDMFKCIFLNENVWIAIEISLKFVPKGSINNNPALLQIMVWRRPGDKPLCETMMVSSLTHICVTQPQWVNEWCMPNYVNTYVIEWYLISIYLIVSSAGCNNEALRAIIYKDGCIHVLISIVYSDVDVNHLSYLADRCLYK